jgi:hypothetical protein
VLDDGPVVHVAFRDVPLGDHFTSITWPIEADAVVLGVEDEYLRVQHPNKKKPKHHEVSVRAEGLVSLEGLALRFDYRFVGTFDDAEFSTQPRMMDVPLHAVRSLRFERRVLRADRLIVQPRSLEALSGLPVRLTNELSLRIRRQDRSAAQELVTEARYRAASAALGELTP